MRYKYAILCIVFLVFLSQLVNSTLDSSDKISFSNFDNLKKSRVIDTGLHKDKGITMNLVKRGLTHKVLEINITKNIPIQDIGLFLDENNVNIKNGKLTRKVVRFEPVDDYKVVCNTTYEYLNGSLNGSLQPIQTCHEEYNGVKYVKSVKWIPLIKLKHLLSSKSKKQLHKYNIVGAGTYRFEFDTPIVKTKNGFGNTGAIYMMLNDTLFVDKQHSSWWNESFPYRKYIIINTTSEAVRKYYTIEVSGFNTTDSSKFNQTNPNNFEVVCDGVSVDKVIGNNTDLQVATNTKMYPDTTGWGTDNTTFLFRLPKNISASTYDSSSCAIYYGDLSYTSTYNNKSNIALLYDDFNRPDSSVMGNNWVEHSTQTYWVIYNNYAKNTNTGGVMTHKLQIDGGICNDCEKWELINGLTWGGGANDEFAVFVDAQYLPETYGDSTDNKGVRIHERSKDYKVEVKNCTSDSGCGMIKKSDFDEFISGQDDVFRIISLDDCNRGDYIAYYNYSYINWDITNTTMVKSDCGIINSVRLQGGRTGNLMDWIMLKRYMDNPPIITLSNEQTNTPPPNFEPIDDFTLSEDFGYYYMNLSNNVSSPANLSLTIQYQLNNSNLINVSLNNNTLNFTLYSLPNTFGNVNITLTAIDSNNNENSTSFILTINSVDDPISFSPISDFSLPEDFGSYYINLSNNITDPDKELLDIFYTLNNSIVTISLDNATKNLTLYSIDNVFGNTTINITAKDSNNNTNSTQFKLTIYSVNDVPLFYPISDFKIEPLSTLSINLSNNVSDVETSLRDLEITYSLNNSNINVSLSNFTKIFSIDRVSNVNGSTLVNLSVWDEDGDVNSTTFTISYQKIIFSVCSSWDNNNTIPIYNLTLYDEKTQDIISGTFEANFKIWQDDEDNYAYITLPETNNNSIIICTNKPNQLYNTNAHILYYGPAYPTRNYFFRYRELNSSTNQTTIPLQKLYLLNDTYSTGLKIVVTDDVETALDDSYIYVEKKDVADNSFYTIGMLHTDANGEGYIPLEYYNTWYRFRIYSSSNNYLYTTSEAIVQDSPLYIRTTATSVGQLLENFEGLDYTFTFNNDTSSYEFSYTDTTGALKELCLEVKELTLSNTNQSVCKKCSTSNSGQLTCTIPDLSKSYIGVIYAKQNPTKTIAVLYYQKITNIGKKLGVEGIAYSILILLTIIFMFLYSPVLAVLMALAGLVAIELIGLVAIPYIALVGIMAVGVVIIITSKD